MMTKDVAHADMVADVAVDRRFHRLLWTGVLVVATLTIGGFLWGLFAESRDPLRQAVAGFAVGWAILSAGSIVLTVWPPLARRFGLPTHTAGDERENRINNIAIQWAYQVCMLGTLGYGLWTINMIPIYIALAAQAVQMTLLIVLNRRM